MQGRGAVKVGEGSAVLGVEVLWVREVAVEAAGVWVWSRVMPQGSNLWDKECEKRLRSGVSRDLRHPPSPSLCRPLIYGTCSTMRGAAVSLTCFGFQPNAANS